ncbi:TadE/TadG family type IV pilus assembly protein [Devosia marina]|uniref:Pilus assembly protein n=1 Tax=Devosia marina TaxID=2683198 RepID=A0A7X3FUG6_9HYPH|nr:TadE/TadG family type IV pilus assembly protein [Devosia marina]MVT00859.1 pilus assembly protein [Devosia marina]
MRRPGACFLTDRSGAAAIEFAILTPVFLLMLTGMLAYGIYFGAAHSVQQLAADAARTAIAGLNQAERNSLVAAYLARNAGDYPLLNPARLTHTIGDSHADPTQYVVRLSYDATDLPIWNLYPPLPLPAKTIAHGATIRRGGL